VPGASRRVDIVEPRDHRASLLHPLRAARFSQRSSRARWRQRIPSELSPITAPSCSIGRRRSAGIAYVADRGRSGDQLVEEHVPWSESGAFRVSRLDHLKTHPQIHCNCPADFPGILSEPLKLIVAGMIRLLLVVLAVGLDGSVEQVWKERIPCPQGSPCPIRTNKFPLYCMWNKRSHYARCVPCRRRT